MVLIIGAASDGVFYNRPIASQAIYPFNDTQTIEIKYQNDILLALRKVEDEWVVTSPFHAPAKASRVSLLLDSNVQTARSYSEATLKEDADPTARIGLSERFPDPVELRLNDNLFLLGDIEPVSQLRYVSANHRVYLQADHIVPLLQSAKSTFTDLNIATSVNAVILEQPTSAASTGAPTTPVPAEQLTHWDNLDALTIVNADLLDQPSIAGVTVHQTAGHSKSFDISRFQQHVALRPPDANYAYLISEEQASKLGICVYCDTGGG